MNFNYDKDGKPYSTHRQADPYIAGFIQRALGDSKTVINVGAGAGSYEPLDRTVTAVEPSKTMRSQRPEHLVTAIDATADALPFDDDMFDAAMAILTIHHWPDPAAGLRELRRVTRGPVLILTFDPDAKTEFWMVDYVPEMAVVERKRYGSLNVITDVITSNSHVITSKLAVITSACEVIPIPIPRDCTDRFQVALYARPEEFLNPAVRQSQSTWPFLPPGVEERFVATLKRDLESGAWDKKYGHLRAKPFINCQLRLIVSRQ